LESKIVTDRTIIPITHIERKPGSDKYRIAGKGVTVEFLAQFINDPAWPVERICQNYDLTPGEVYAAWSFYSDHRAEIDRRVTEGEERVERYLAEHPEHDARRNLLSRQGGDSDG
jgi:uncharacterized protein (DUF433 family)